MRRGPLRACQQSHRVRRRYTTRLLESVTRQRPGEEHAPQQYLRCFPLRADDVVEPPDRPEAFHRTLCRKIRESSKRVQLASLYVGPAADTPASKGNDADRNQVATDERELLESIRQASSGGVPVQILLDANRALRPVPVPVPSPHCSPDTIADDATTTSAHACCEAIGIETGNSPASGVFLLSVLHPALQRALPNPLNEIAGVFHVKVYVLDDDVILSGANLSREYFTTRIDRYLHLRQPGLVEFYSKLVDALCQHGAVRYGPGQVVDQGRFRSAHWAPSLARRRQLHAALVELFTTTEPPSTPSDPNSVVAYAIPTFQAPKRYFPTSKRLQVLNHEQTLTNLLTAIRNTAAFTVVGQRRFTITARIATAYMNPTRPFLDALAQCCDHTVFLTAGMASHGFAPKKKEPHGSLQGASEDQSRGWAIPNVFRHASRRAVRHILRRQQRSRRNQLSDSSQPYHEQASVHRSAQVAYYQRPGWTFHAKGMWLSMQDVNAAPGDEPKLAGVELTPTERLAAVCTGSGNYGARSALRDMESNLLLIFPPSPVAFSQPSPGDASSMQDANPLVRQHVEEWNQLCAFASEKEEEPEPPRWVRFLFPWVRPFF